MLCGCSGGRVKKNIVTRAHDLAGAGVAVEVVLALDLEIVLPLHSWAVPTNTSDVRMSYALCTHVVRTCK